MKNSQIHVGLPQANLRDFFAISIEKNFKLECENIKEALPCRTKEESSFERAIKVCKNEIDFQNRRLQLLKEISAIHELIKMQGWEEFDVSDETEKDIELKISMNFIGTKSEYDEFIGKLEKNK